MVTCCGTKLTATCSPMIGQFIDTMMLASTFILLVVMVTYCGTKLTATCSPMIGQFIDTMMLASTFIFPSWRCIICRTRRNWPIYCFCVCYLHMQMQTLCRAVEILITTLYSTSVKMFYTGLTKVFIASPFCDKVHEGQVKRNHLSRICREP